MCYINKACDTNNVLIVVNCSKTTKPWQFPIAASLSKCFRLKKFDFARKTL